MTMAIRSLENLAQTARGIGDIGAAQLQGERFLTEQKFKSLQYPGLALGAMQNESMIQKLKQPVRMSNFIQDNGTLDWFTSPGPLGEKGTPLIDKIAQTVGAQWDKNPESQTNGMLVKDGRPLTNMDIAPYRGQIANWTIAYADPDHIHDDQIERYTRAAEANPDKKDQYMANIKKAQEWKESPESRITTYRKLQATLLTSPLSDTPEIQAQSARLDTKIKTQEDRIPTKLEAMKAQTDYLTAQAKLAKELKPEKDTYDMLTIYGPKKGQTKRVSIPKGSDYTPPAEWSIEEPDWAKEGAGTKIETEMNRARTEVYRQFKMMTEIGWPEESDQEAANEAVALVDSYVKEQGMTPGKAVNKAVKEVKLKYLPLKNLPSKNKDDDGGKSFEVLQKLYVKDVDPTIVYRFLIDKGWNTEEAKNLMRRAIQ